MSIRPLLLSLSFTIASPAVLCSQTEALPPTVPVDSALTQLVAQYQAALQQLVSERDTANERALPALVPDAYFYQLLSAPTLYSAPVHQTVGSRLSHSDPQMLRLQAVNSVLARLYTQHPSLVVQTEEAVREQGKLREDIAEKIHAQDQLSSHLVAASLKPQADEVAEVKTRRPNFWKFPGTASFHFTQNYYSKNWVGQENRYSGLSTLILNANYNDERHLTWNNNLNMGLGFQTNKSDKRRTFRPTTNSIVYTTNAGLKAIKTWSYTANVRVATQIVPVYDPNTDRVSTDFLSPMDVTIGPGMGSPFKFGKKKKFTGNINIQPLAYNIKYVQRASLVTRYGVRPGHHSKHTFGPSINVTYVWPIATQVKWTGGINWYSNLHLTRIDWTNRFDFTVNKFISATLNIHPIFDDSSPQWKGKHDYIRMEENLSLGLTYNF